MHSRRAHRLVIGLCALGILGGFSILFRQSNIASARYHFMQMPGDGGGGIPTPPTCTPHWQCTAWSTCSADGVQTRTCTDLHACGTNSGKPPEVQSCTPPYLGNAQYDPEHEQEPKYNPSIAQGPDEVYLHNGEVYLHEVDLRIPSRGFDYTFERAYKSQIEYNGVLGNNWNFNSNTRLQEKAADANAPLGYVCVNDGLLRQDCFIRNADSTYTAPSGIYDVLTKSGSVYLLRKPDGFKDRFRDIDGTNASGSLLSMTDRNGNVMQFMLDGFGRLETVLDTLGRAIHYTYNASGRLSYITDFAGRRVTFSYDVEGDLIAVTGPSVTGTSNGNDFPNGKTTKYAYSSQYSHPALKHNLVTITRPNETALAPDGPAVLTNVYGISTLEPATFDKIVRQDYGGTNAAATARAYGPAGGRFTFLYEYPNDCTAPVGLEVVCERTTMVDRNGNVSAYEHNQNGNRLTTTQSTGRVDPMSPVLPATGPFRANDPASFVTSATYSSAGEKLTETYPEGNSIEYQYDTANPNISHRGNILEIIRQPGSRGGSQGSQQASYTYEPIFNRVRTVTTNRAFGLTFSPPIPDFIASANVRRLDFNLDGDINDPLDKETTRRYRYTSLQVFDYQEGTASQILALAATEGVALTSTQATALSLNADTNGDGVSQAFGNVIEDLQPNVTLESGAKQEIITTTTYNAYGQVVSTVDPEGNLEVTTYAGGYKQSVVHDANPAAAANSGTARRTRTAPYVSATETFTVDSVGNITSRRDGRGITTTFEVNALNQPIRETRGVVGAGFNANGEEPTAPIVSLGYERVWTYDANNNVIQQDVENTDGNNALVSANPWITTAWQYDILDAKIAEVKEVSNGEVGTTESTTTLLYYDKNGHLALTASPVVTLPAGNPERQENNVTAMVYDERDLPYRESRGGIDAVFLSLKAAGKAHENIAISLTPQSTTATTTKNYDGDGNLVTFIDAADNGLTNAEGGDVTTSTYDGYNRIVSMVDPMGFESVQVYDPDNNLVHTQRYGTAGGNMRGDPEDPAVNKLLSDTWFDADEVNRQFRTRATYFLTPSGSPAPESPYITRYLFDRNSRTTQTTDADGHIAGNEYDGLNRVVRAFDQELPKAGGGTVRNEAFTTYDDNSNALKTISIDRSPTSAADETFTTVTLYDAVNRPVRQTDNYGNTTRRAYDSRGNTVLTTDASGTLITDPVTNSAYRFPYASSPSGATQINQPGQETNSTYDNLNRLVRTVRDADAGNAHNPDGAIETTIDYDQNSRLVSQTDDADPLDSPGQSTTTYAYDDLSRLVQETYADGSDAEYVYDKDGHVSTFTDPNGSVFSPEYDDLGRKTRESVIPATGVEGTTIQLFEYDGLSRLTRSSDVGPDPEADDAWFVSTYDSLSRLTSQQQGYVPGAAYTVAAAYDRDGSPIQLTYPNGRMVTRGFDGLDRLALIEEGPGTGTGNGIVPDTDPANDIAAFSYIGPNRVLEQQYQASAMTTSLTYDGIRRPMTVVADGTEAPVLDLAYAYNRIGNRLYEQFNQEADQQADVFAYDALPRLTTAWSHVPGSSSEFQTITNNQLANPNITTGSIEGEKTWTMDGAQNWRSVTTQTPDGTSPAGQGNKAHGASPTATVETTYTPNRVNAYEDVNGTARVYDANGNLKDDGTFLYTYDPYNRLYKVTSKANSSEYARYRYDTHNRRVYRDVHNLNGITEGIRYLYNNWSVLEERDGVGTVLAQYVDGTTADQHIQMIRDGTTSYYHQNPIGNIEAITDTVGAVAERYDYDAYGQSTATITTPTGNPYRFAGERQDPETGLVYMKNRYYEPETGRFISRDPQGMWQDQANIGNGYAYVGNNPVNLVDPLGLSARTVNCSAEKPFEGTPLPEQGHYWPLNESTPIMPTNTTGEKKETSPPPKPEATAKVQVDQDLIKREHLPGGQTADPEKKGPTVGISVGGEVNLSGTLEYDVTTGVRVGVSGNTGRATIGVTKDEAVASLGYTSAEVTITVLDGCVSGGCAAGFGAEGKLDFKTGKFKLKLLVGIGISIELNIFKIGEKFVEQMDKSAHEPVMGGASPIFRSGKVTMEDWSITGPFCD